MADRTQYYHEWYLKNKEHKINKTQARLKKLKRKLGAKKFKEWKQNENRKYVERRQF